MAGVDIIVPRREIEVAVDLVAVEFVGPAEPAEVGGDELRRRHARAQHIELVFLEIDPLAGDEALLLEHQAGIALLGIEGHLIPRGRSEEHTSELQSLMRISYAVFCL